MADEPPIGNPRVKTLDKSVVTNLSESYRKTQKHLKLCRSHLSQVRLEVMIQQ